MTRIGRLIINEGMKIYKSDAASKVFIGVSVFSICYSPFAAIIDGYNLTLPTSSEVSSRMTSQICEEINKKGDEVIEKVSEKIVSKDEIRQICREELRDVVREEINRTIQRYRENRPFWRRVLDNIEISFEFTDIGSSSTDNNNLSESSGQKLGSDKRVECIEGDNTERRRA